MASFPDQNPHSPPAGPDDTPNPFEEGQTPAREDHKDDGRSPMEDPGSDGGTGGTGGTDGPQDHDVTS